MPVDAASATLPPSANTATSVPAPSLLSGTAKAVAVDTFQTVEPESLRSAKISAPLPEVRQPMMYSPSMSGQGIAAHAADGDANDHLIVPRASEAWITHVAPLMPTPAVANTKPPSR